MSPTTERSVEFVTRCFECGEGIAPGEGIPRDLHGRVIEFCDETCLHDAERARLEEPPDDAEAMEEIYGEGLR